MEPVDFIMPGQRKPNLASIRCIIGGLSLSLPPQPHAISVTLVFILQGIRLAKESSKNVSSLPPLSFSHFSPLSLSLPHTHTHTHAHTHTLTPVRVRETGKASPLNLVPVVS